MGTIKANTNKLTIKLYVNEEMHAEILINPSFPGGCRKIYDALKHDADITKKALSDITESGKKDDAVIDYMQGKYDIAGELIDGIAEAIGPDQYEEIASILPCIEIKDLAALAIAIIDSYSEYYERVLKKGFKSNG